MKIRIYKYPDWFGVHHLVDIFVKDEDKAHALANKIDNKFPQINNFFNWIYNKRVRKDKIKIEPFDTWSLDITLAKIVVPMLHQLVATKHGAPNTDNEDVPESLRSEEPEDGSTSPTHFAKWDWIMEEMIYGFEFVLEDACPYDSENYKENSARAKNGRILFAKYYTALWD